MKVILNLGLFMRKVNNVSESFSRKRYKRYLEPIIIYTVVYVESRTENVKLEFLQSRGTRAPYFWLLHKPAKFHQNRC